MVRAADLQAAELLVEVGHAVTGHQLGGQEQDQGIEDKEEKRTLEPGV